MAVSSTQRDLSSILKTSQQKAVSTGALTIGLLAILVWGSLRPTISTIFETNDKFQEKTAVLQLLKTQNSRLTQLLAQREEAKDDLRNLDLYFPYDGNFSLFIVNLNMIARKYEYKMDSVTFSETINKQIENNQALQYDGMKPVSFQVSLTGNSSNLFSYLSYLENTPFFPKVIDISYGSSLNEDKNNLSITFLIYKLNGQLYQ